MHTPEKYLYLITIQIEKTNKSGKFWFSHSRFHSLIWLQTGQMIEMSIIVLESLVLRNDYTGTHYLCVGGLLCHSGHESEGHPLLGRSDALVQQPFKFHTSSSSCEIKVYIGLSKKLSLFFLEPGLRMEESFSHQDRWPIVLVPFM